MARRSQDSVPPDLLPHDRAALEEQQLDKLRRLLGELAAHNRFYAPRLAAAGLDGELATLGDFTARCPFTTKDELVDDQRRHPPYGTNLTYPLARYVRCHQTSGTTGGPLRWLDTAESWAAVTGCWARVFRAAGIGPGERIFFPFSFGPFLGFWGAFDAAWQMGCLALPGGGMTSKGRLRVLLDNAATALCCTPTYALRLAEVAVEEGIDLGRSTVRHLVVAGEPGGGVAAIRERLARAWGGAAVWDHHGMTEVGPVTYPNPRTPLLLHVMESSYLAEVLDPETDAPVGPGGVGELILTTLDRRGSPLLRYRTGDLVRLCDRDPAALGTVDLAFEGGILARADDMVVVRGVNLYPSAVDGVVRSVAGVAEYRVELRTVGALAELAVQVEPAAGCAEPAALAGRLEEALRTAFQLRIPVATAAPGELPRFELKAQRWVRV